MGRQEHGHCFRFVYVVLAKNKTTLNGWVNDKKRGRKNTVELSLFASSSVLLTKEPISSAPVGVRGKRAHERSTNGGGEGSF